jgi:hypothetical protein
MFIAKLEHISTGYPTQIEISLYEFILAKLGFLKILNKKIPACVVAEDYYYKGTVYINDK